MKSAQALPVLLGLAFAMPSGLRAGETEDSAAPGPDARTADNAHWKPKLIRTRLEYIELSHQRMAALMRDPEATKTDTVLRGRVEQLIKAGKAKVVEVQMATSRSGQQATTESIREFTYPTNYQSARIPREVHLHTEGDAPEIPPGDLATGPTPGAFERRYLGPVFKVEANLGQDDERAIDLRIDPEITWHTGNTVWSEWKDKHGKANIEMPVMYTIRFWTSIPLAAGKPCLVTALTPKDEHGKPDYSRKLMVFVRCDIVEVGS